MMLVAGGAQRVNMTLPSADSAVTRSCLCLASPWEQGSSGVASPALPCLDFVLPLDLNLKTNHCPGNAQCQGRYMMS